MSAELPLVALQREGLTATFAPTRGGRLLSLRLGDEELLWQNPALIGEDLRPVTPVTTWPRGDGGMGTWANVGGSKTWPAPQGWSSPDEWAGPPDPVLDSGEWDVVERSATAVTLASAADHRTGLRLRRSFELLGGGRIHQSIVMTNLGSSTTFWAPWEVCQVRTDDGGAILVEGADSVDEVDLGLWEGDVASSPVPDGLRLPVGTAVAKRGFRSGNGVAYRRRSGTTLRLGAAQEAGTPLAAFPDGGCRFEVWLQRPVAEPIDTLDGLHPDAHLAELEVLGRREALAPGASRVVTIRWSVEPSGSGQADVS